MSKWTKMHITDKTAGGSGGRKINPLLLSNLSTQ